MNKLLHDKYYDDTKRYFKKHSKTVSFLAHESKVILLFI